MQNCKKHKFNLIQKREALQFHIVNAGISFYETFNHTALRYAGLFCMFNIHRAGGFVCSEDLNIQISQLLKSNKRKKKW